MVDVADGGRAAGGEAVGGETHVARKVIAVVFNDHSHYRTKMEENKHQVLYCFEELRRLCHIEDGFSKLRIICNAFSAAPPKRLE
jgi:hypothetical protein